jgi:hypothetical protein
VPSRGVGCVTKKIILSLQSFCLFRHSIDDMPNARLGARIDIANDVASKSPMPPVRCSSLSGASPYQARTTRNDASAAAIHSERQAVFGKYRRCCGVVVAAVAVSVELSERPRVRCPVPDGCQVLLLLETIS